jgi:hypothetical protein
MTFEDESKNYIVTLKESNIVIDMIIIGVNEELRTSTCIGSFLNQETSVIVEKYVKIYELNDQITWSYLITLETNE